MKRQFVPVLLGTEIGAYGMARAFWEQYQLSSLAYGVFPLTPTRHSKFIEQRCDERLMEPGRLIQVLNADASRLGDTVGLVIPCGDEYSVMLSDHAGELDAHYRAISSPAGTLSQLNDKSRFYELCERAGVPYPKAVTVDASGIPETLPFSFPVALKPTDAYDYRNHPFTGQKKALIVENRAMLEEAFCRIYAAGYSGRLVVQDFVPGRDGDNMRVVNGYVRQDGTIALLALGQPVLEDCAPMRIGNYAAIISYGDETIYAAVEGLLRHINYFGYFNIDLKIDPRDGVAKFLDFNPRQGRSSFFTTLAGYNLARPVVEDVIQHKGGSAVHATKEVLWCGVPRSIVRKYLPQGPARDHALELMRQGKVGTTLFGAHDNNPRRLFDMAKLWAHYHQDFQRYFGKRELDD